MNLALFQKPSNVAIEGEYDIQRDPILPDGGGRLMVDSVNCG